MARGRCGARHLPLIPGGEFRPINRGQSAQVSKRVQVTRSQEEYQLWGSYESEPDGAAITACMKETVPLLLRGREGEVSPNKKKKDAGKWWL